MRRRRGKREERYRICRTQCFLPLLRLAVRSTIGKVKKKLPSSVTHETFCEFRASLLIALNIRPLPINSPRETQPRAEKEAWLLLSHGGTVSFGAPNPRDGGTTTRPVFFVLPPQKKVKVSLFVAVLRIRPRNACAASPC